MDKVEALRGGEKRRQSHVGRRQSLTSSHVEQMKETLKERAAKYKKEREERKAELTPVHKRITEQIAQYVMMCDPMVVEDFILDSAKQIELINDFTKKGGRRTITVYCQIGDPPTVESGRTVASKDPVMKCFVTDGSDASLTGQVVIFFKRDVQLSARNISDEMSMHVINLQEDGGMLTAFQKYFDSIVIPQITNNDKWGALDENEQGRRQINGFWRSLADFPANLGSAQSNIAGAVKLVDAECVCNIDELKTEELAKDGEYVKDVAGVVEEWIKQITQVLAESAQMRKEADDTGPLAELEHWRFLEARFNSFLEQLKEPKCRYAIQILSFAKSKVLAKWKQIDMKITDQANEAADNARYLRSLEPACKPLYAYDPISMIEHIPNLIKVISNIYQVSRYYNTSQRMTSLFIKVTNQMVTACNNHITANGTLSVWEQDYATVQRKISDCIQLHDRYIENYQRESRRFEEQVRLGRLDPSKRFDFSEIYIFGKYENFVKRVSNINELLNTIKIFSSLKKCHIEGIDSINSNFDSIVESIKRKPYDILDHRRTDFNNDFLDFKRDIDNLQGLLCNFMDNCFDKATTTEQVYVLINRFKKLNIACIDVDIQLKWDVYCKLYYETMLKIKRDYEECKTNDSWHVPQDWPRRPGIVRCMESWAQRITQPMNVLKQHAPRLIEPEYIKKNKLMGQIVMLHDKFGRLVLEWAQMNYMNWFKNVDKKVQVALRAPLLVRDPEKKFYVNYDPEIEKILREAKYFDRIGTQFDAADVYKLPQGAKDLLRRKDSVKEARRQMESLLNTYEEQKARIPPIFQPLMEGHIREVHQKISKGLIYICWNSLIQDKFFHGIAESLAQLKRIIDEVIDLKEQRIDVLLDRIANYELINLPTDKSIKVNDFIEFIKKQTTTGATFIEKYSQTIEDAIHDLIAVFVSHADHEKVPPNFNIDIRYKLADDKDDDDTEADSTSMEDSIKRENDFEQFCREVITYFKNRCLEKITFCLKQSLETIKRRVLTSKNAKDDKTPLFCVDINLAIPHVTFSPSLDELQQVLNKAARYIVETGKSITAWSQHRVCYVDVLDEFGEVNGRKVENIPLENLQNWFPVIQSNKEFAKNLMVLNSAVNSFREPGSYILKTFTEYQELWEGDRDQLVHEFINPPQDVENPREAPSLSELKAEIQRYVEKLDEIEEIEENFIIGSLSINASNIKLALKVEAKEWKRVLSSHMYGQYVEKMNTTFDFIDEVKKKLSREIKDLDDVRFAMDALKTIREEYSSIENIIPPIEEAFSLLSKYEFEIDSDMSNKCDSIRYAWKRCIDLGKKVQDDLEVLAPQFQNNLVEAVEQFRQDNIDFEEAYAYEGPMVDGIKPSQASERLAIFQSRFDGLFRKFITYSSGEELFGLAVTNYPQLESIKKELSLLQKLYGLYNAVMDSIDGYYDIPWSEVDTEKINSELLDFQNKCKKLPKALKEWQAFLDLSQRITDFSECCPLLELMSNKAMKQRHWDRIEATTKCKFDPWSENFLLRHIMEAPLLENKDDLEDICISSVKENDIEAKLNQVIAEWGAQDFGFASFKARGELLLKGQETTDIVSLMEDSLMVLSSLMSNRYNAPFKPTIQAWVSKLSNSNEIIEQWLIVQNLWVYLEAVFVGGDIAKQLPDAAKRFANIDKSWVKIMTRAADKPNVVQCCVGDEFMGQLLPHLFEQLECCQKSLTGYLEAKRLIFPRFFFISDPALLEILGQASDSHTIQAHLLGIFENVAQVEFNAKDYNRIDAVLSREGEKVPLDEPVQAVGNVEDWIGKLLRLQQSSLHSVIRFAAYEILEPETFDLLPFLNKYPAQVGLLGIQMIWTKEAEEALVAAKSDKKIMQSTNQRFLLLLNTLIDQTTHDLSKFDRIKFETLVTIHVHQRDIFDQLTKWHIKSPLDFEWLKQARFYFDTDAANGLGRCLVSITDVDFDYQNEFLGCTDRLVITPLTDRCYITLAQALGMALGGAPAGPAGTGKTETTKDMAKALGKYCVVFNCSDQMDFRGLGRIYKGLAQSGSWGCFDEFNRIDLPVLSVAAQQIYIVLMAKKERKRSFIFTDGDDVTLNPEFGLFITMNPGYAGRQELPENLKVQFRSVAMMVPDRQIIKRVKLASCGFQTNEILARKFFTLYKLCEEQLTKQVHYDFGLRNILSVLRTLGAEKRKNPDDTEERIVMRVLRDMNMSKLVDEDEPLFISLIGDLFPGISLGSASHDELQQHIQNNVDKMGDIVNHPSWNLKVIQLYETQLVRHGIMTLGPTGAGKTRSMRTLMGAFTDMGTPHKELRMNPKSITAPQMFGRLDVATNDWTDGIFSTLWRRSHKTKKGDFVWIILDGPVDAIWIENLNSVLDDNKTLTLANGDRLVMAPNSKLVFEVHNIDNASPATVSRMGMIFMSSSALDWKPILDGWLLSRPPTEAGVFYELFHKEDVFDQCFRMVLQLLEPKMKLYECNYIRQACTILTGLIPDDESKGNITAEVYERLFIFALMWSLGCVLELSDRDAMAQFLVAHPSKLDLPDIPADTNFTIFEYVVNMETGEWEHWMDRVTTFDYPTDPEIDVPDYSGILIPNVDNTRTNFLIDIIAKQEKSVLLIGEQGTGKTVMIAGYCSKYDPEEHMFKSFNFSSATEPHMFQNTIEALVDKRVGTTYGPPGGRKMTVFIDDVNMPVVNEWGDQITNEITRQMMEQKGMFSLLKPGDFTNIVDIQFVASMIHPGGGRNDIPERLKSQFTIFNCTLPADNSIDHIFSTIAAGYFARGFPQPVQEIVSTLVPTTRLLWQQTKAKMLPTPAKFHYVFNLRDLSRIWQTILNVSPDECDTPEMVVALWKHECTRVIADRFTNLEDKAWFDNNLNETLQGALGDVAIHDEPFFVDFMREAPEPTGDEDEDADLDAPKVYELVPSLKFLEDRVRDYMQTYNETVRGANMDMVFFKDALTHLIKISRIIRTPSGNALLVGVGGSGKQSLTKLASFIAGYKVFQITLTRSYNVVNLLDDLKVLYRDAGVHAQGYTFILTDNEIKDEGFLEPMNNLLSCGEISGLFARDETDEILAELVPIMKKVSPKTPPTQDNLYEFFISRARSNLHVVLCFSPVGEKFQQRSLKFPGLFSGCTMDWFTRWPKDALIAVSSHFLSGFPLVCSEDTKTQIIETMGCVHDCVQETCLEYFERFRRTTHVTPKSYLSFLEGYTGIYGKNLEHLQHLAARMNTGLDKLVEAGESVDQLSKELEVKKVDLEVATVKTNAVLEEVAVASASANKVKAAVLIVKNRALEIVNSIQAEEAIANEKLAAAEPALRAAEEALNTIKAADIATVRKLAKPPHLIMRIMDCILLLFQENISATTQDPERESPTPSWSDALKLMSQSSFLSNLLNFNKDTINDEVVELLEPYFRMDDYTFENAKKVCGNVAGLLSWTKAMASFYSVNKEVVPLKMKLAAARARLSVAQRELDSAQAELDEKEREAAEVQAKFDAAMSEKQALEDDASSCMRRMSAATQLIDGLQGEKVRWTAQSLQFDSQINRLVGDVLLATGFLSYTGPFNQEFRNLLIKDRWLMELEERQIPYTENLDLVGFLTDAATIGDWALQGLPTDDLSIQNGLIVTKASRYPLLIDPQIQGKGWIKNREKKNDLMLTSLNHKYFRSHLEDALSLGRPLLIEDVGEQLDPALDNVLEKNFIKSGSRYKVKVGDKECDVMPGFVLYITTKLPNPRYTPEVSARTSIIDFTVTSKGLEDQLLGRVILTEKAELEAERTKLMEEVNDNKRKMQELEDNLLYKLTSTKGSLVDDESLIIMLQTTKKTAAEVSEKLAIAHDTNIKINSAREEFRPVATRGSILYFLITKMQDVNVMYQTSLYQFLELFDNSMACSAKSPVNQKRIQNIIEYLTFAIHKYTCRSLYEEHKLLFVLLMTLQIDLGSDKIKHAEFSVFIKGGAALDLASSPQKPASVKWISDMNWLNLVQLKQLSEFRDILQRIATNDKQWKVWWDTDAPEEEVIPDGYDKSLDTFKRLLLIRSLCLDRALPQSLKYIGDSLGTKYADPVILNLEEMLKESTVRVPLVCLLSMGSDPTNQICDLAKKLSFECRCISMGQGQEVHARRLLALAKDQGGWVLLQNCHLGLDFMEELLEFVLTCENPNPTMRIWVTVEPHPEFSITLLQSSIKFTNEPPQGIRAGLKRSFSEYDQDYLDINGLPEWKPLIYAVAFTHTTVQERRKFGPIGWNIPYEFNSSDQSATMQFIQNHLDDLDPKRGIQWSTVRYMIGEVNYGGRVTDDFDKRLLNTYTQVWFSPNTFSDKFCFYKGYTIPKYMTCDQVMEAINVMSLTDSPEAFGLHPNADITYQTRAGGDVLATIVDIQPKDSSGGGGETREEKVYRMADEMLSKLPSDFIPHEVQARMKKMGEYASLNIFLRQEIDRMQRVLLLVRLTLSDLKLAIEGTIIMSENLRDALDNMFDARVPTSWKKISWEASTLGFWFSELQDRDAQFRAWCFEGRPKSFWMTGFFNPQGFLTAMRQEVTRMHKGWALDSVTIANDVTKHNYEDLSNGPNEGVYVHGLFLDGANWDRKNNRLCDPQPKVLNVQMPIIHIYAINSTAPKDPALYTCPCYKKPRRTDLTFISSLWLKTNMHPSRWVLRGVALLCDIK